MRQYLYARTQEEMAHTCRGTINLAAAFIDTIDSTNFMITNGPSQVYHLRALNEVERQRWVTALELAKAKAIKKLDSGKMSPHGLVVEHCLMSGVDESDCQSRSEDESTEGGATAGSVAVGGNGPHENLLTTLQDKLKELTAAYELVVKNSHQFSKFAGELESVGSAAKAKERVALLKITSTAVVKVRENLGGLW